MLSFNDFVLLILDIEGDEYKENTLMKILKKLI